MIANHVAENVLGTIGAICWSVQLVPQVYKSYKRKDTAGLSSWLLGIWFVGGVFLGAYVVIQKLNIPLQVQPQAFTLLAGICWAQCLHYDQGWSSRKAGTFAVVACAVAGGLEVAMVFGAKAAERAGHSQATTVWGVCSAVFIAGGLIPQYIEIYRFKAVIGISLVFLLVDLFGGIFSLLSLVFAEGSFDILASLSYGIVVVLEIGVFILAALLNPSHRKRLAAKHRADREALAGTPRPPTPSNMSEGTTRAASMISSKTPEEEARGRVGEREVGVRGWMDAGVALEEEARVEGVRRPESVERR